MIKRWVVIFLFLIIPVSARAVGAGELGPTTSSTGTSDPGTANILQPANPSSLQPAGAAEGGINLPTASGDLQPAGDKNQIKDFLAGEGSPVSLGNTESTDNRYPWLLGLGALTLAIFAGALYWSSRRNLVVADSLPSNFSEVDKPVSPELTSTSEEELNHNLEASAHQDPGPDDTVDSGNKL